MKILVTGGYGFIGSHLVERLAKERHDITIIDDLSTGEEIDLKGKITFFKIGVEDTKCEKIFEDFKFDVVVHLAFKELPKEDNNENVNIYHTNNIGLSNILFFSQKYNVSKVIVASSYQVYGNQENLPIYEYNPIDLESKKAGSYLEREYFCKKYQDKGLNLVILRLASLYGPRQPKNFVRRIITKTCKDEMRKYTIINEAKDYLYIKDAVEAIYKTCENPTSKILNISSGVSIKHSDIQEIINSAVETDNKTTFKYIEKHTRANYLLANQRATSELGWSPKYSIEEGIRKTVDWSIKKIDNNKNDLEEKKQTLFSKIKGKNFFGRASKYIENLILFIIFALLMVVFDRKLFIKVDLFIIYIVIVNIYYGWGQGIIAILLSIVAHIGIQMGYENITVVGIFNNISKELYIALYFIIGGITGYLAERIKVEKSELQSELDRIKDDLYFTVDMYNKSIEIKNSLQETIESNEDSLGKIYNIISNLNNIGSEHILLESAKVFSEMLKTDSVHIYHLNSMKDIRLAALVGNIRHEKILSYEDYDFLESVIDKGKVFINEDFVEAYPMVCAPIVQDGLTTAIVLLDDLKFKRLTYQFLNTLKVLTYLVANAITRANECENSLNKQNNIKNKVVLKKDWVELEINEKRMNLSQDQLPICLIIFNKNNNEKNIKLYERIKDIFSESDYIVEMDNKKITILLFNTDKEEAIEIKTKLSDLGISDTHIEPMRRIM